MERDTFVQNRQQGSTLIETDKTVHERAD